MAAPGRVLIERLAGYDPHVVRVALALRNVVLEEAPAAVESVVKGYAVAIGFSFTGKPLKDGFCHIAVYRGHVNLGFNRGAAMADPAKVLEGTGKSIRHVTMRDEADVSRAWVRRYLRAAVEGVILRDENERE